MSTYNITEFSKATGVAVKTLQKWDRDGRLVPGRTVTNRRVYSDENLSVAIGRVMKSEDRKTVVYCRVSSQSQKPDLENQVKTMEMFCAGAGHSVDEWVKEIGGGLNFKRKKFLSLIDSVIAGKTKMIIIAHKDRLARFGFDLILHVCKVRDCQIVVMNMESLSPQEEMIQDMLSIVHCFSARLYGLRNYKKVLKGALGNDKSTQDTPESNK